MTYCELEVSDGIMKKVKHNEWLREQLKDPGFSAEYLTAAAEDEEPAVFLQALRKVAEAQGMATVAKRAGIPGKVCIACCRPRATRAGQHWLRSFGQRA